MNVVRCDEQPDRRCELLWQREARKPAMNVVRYANLPDRRCEELTRPTFPAKMGEKPGSRR